MHTHAQNSAGYTGAAALRWAGLISLLPYPRFNPNNGPNGTAKLSTHKRPGGAADGTAKLNPHPLPTASLQVNTQR